MRRGGSIEYPQSMFWIKNVREVDKPQFCGIKVGYEGYTIHGHIDSVVKSVVKHIE